MPNKWLKQKGITLKKQKYKVSNWSDYNRKLKNRGDVEIWLSQDLINHWYYEERIYDGTGSSQHYTEEAIIACHELRQVYKLPLRQTEGFINSLQKCNIYGCCQLNRSNHRSPILVPIVAGNSCPNLQNRV